jgi:sugar phosphate isomerase/epimerase
MMKIGCNTVAFRRSSLDFALKEISAAGYKYVEVEANLLWCPHVDPWKDDPQEFMKKVKSYGFEGVSAIGSHRELITSQEGVDDIRQALKWAKEAGVPCILTGEGRKPEDMSEEDALSILADRYAELGEVAEACQVHLALEDHGTISLKPEGLPKLLKIAKNEWIGVNFDTANIHRGDYVGTDRGKYEWKLGGLTSYSETELLEKVVDRVRHTHIKDVVGRDAVTLGHGEIDLIGCLDILNKGGYQGVLSYETEGMEEPDESRKMIVESRDFLIKALKKYK